MQKVQAVTADDEIAKPFHEPVFEDDHRKAREPMPDGDRVSTLIPANPNVVLVEQKKSVTGAIKLDKTKFPFDYVFADDHTTADIFETMKASEHFVDVAINNGIGYMVAFGATGSGKTHTMSASGGGSGSEPGLQLLCVENLFQRLAQVSAEKNWQFEVSVTGIEISGKCVKDLGIKPSAAAAANAVPVEIREDDLGRPQIRGAVSHIVSSPSVAMRTIQEMIERRRTSSTLRNDTSSRTHFATVLNVRNVSLPLSEVGQMMFVDLAGSEAAIDKADHDVALLREAAVINKSLSTLKECFRARVMASAGGAHVHIPYRADKLCLLLKNIFEPATFVPTATILCCCVSPLPRDVLHSAHSLKYISPMKMAIKQSGALVRSKADPSTWSAEQVTAFFTKVSKGRLDIPRLLGPHGMTGVQMMRMPQSEFLQRCMEQGLPETAAATYFGEFWILGSKARDARRQQIKAPVKNGKEDLSLEHELLDRIAQEERDARSARSVVSSMDRDKELYEQMVSQGLMRKANFNHQL